MLSWLLSLRLKHMTQGDLQSSWGHLIPSVFDESWIIKAACLTSPWVCSPIEFHEWSHQPHEGLLDSSQSGASVTALRREGPHGSLCMAIQAVPLVGTVSPFPWSEMGFFTHVPLSEQRFLNAWNKIQRIQEFKRNQLSWNRYFNISRPVVKIP